MKSIRELSIGDRGLLHDGKRPVFTVTGVGETPAAAISDCCRMVTLLDFEITPATVLQLLCWENFSTRSDAFFDFFITVSWS